MEELIPKKIRKIPRKKIVPIIHRKYAEPITELVKFWYLKISDKRCLSVLSVRAPSLPREFEHLKRINKGAFFLLEPVSENQKLSEEAVEAIEGIEGVALDIICVPGKAPLSKYQMDLIKDIWPVNFKPQFNIEKMMCGKLFDRTETDRILRFYDEVCVTDSIIIYDPMEYVVRVRIPKFQKCHEIDHPVMRALNELAIIQKKALSEGDCEQYLATNYYCILPTECCAMCTMALVHSRIGKVFFGDLIHEKGAFLSTWRMMECPKINHHFDLFRIVDDEDKCN
uniref:CMP/dCMP-type deaminase domain-containing protein n=1 Tax=Rhabditophanes sp. KR3021 TaxID=114890 RepID=A0AC35TPD0_9BILA